MKTTIHTNLCLCCLVLVLVSLADGCNVSSPVQGTAPTTSPVSPVVSVTISPQSFALKRGASGKFSAAVANSSDTSVTWSIQEGSAGGTITDAGVYTAPSVDGVYHVIATSKAGPTKSATAYVSVGASAFTLVGSLSVGRSSHTATRLPSGQVLMVGGVSGAGNQYTVADQIEQFDPAIGKFQTIGKLARTCHSTTLLANGDILIAGGATDLTAKAPIALAEILKTGTGVLQPTGNMTVARCGHTATLLQDGRVLITGGEAPTETNVFATQSAELYDPVSGTFAPAGNMTLPQVDHTAILLLTGKVLIVGFGSADLYDPATNSFTPTSNPPVKRFDFATASLPDGRVLISGGETYWDDVYVGPDELFDPATGRFTPTGKLTIARCCNTATLLPDGTVLVAGGLYDANNVPTDTTEIYDPATGSFSLGPKMQRARAAHSATLLSDGSVLLAGGWSPGGSDASAEIYQ